DRLLPEAWKPGRAARQHGVLRAPRPPEPLPPLHDAPRVVARAADEGGALEPPGQAHERELALDRAPPTREGLAEPHAEAGRSHLPRAPDPEVPVGAPDPDARPARRRLHDLVQSSEFRVQSSEFRP